MSSFKKQEKYTSDKCECCGQTKTYLLPVDRGTVDILKSIARAILKKGINVIHPRKEMEIDPNRFSPGAFDYDLMVKEGHLTSNMVGNLSRPRFHGLIAKVKNEPGNYCLTSKGGDFLKGESIPKYAVIDKTTGHKKEYWLSEKYRVTIKDFSSDEEYWEGLDYVIRAGRVIEKIEEKKDYYSDLQASKAAKQQNNLF